MKKKIKNLTKGDMFITANGHKFLYCDLNSPLIRRNPMSKKDTVHFKHMGPNTVVYIWFSPLLFGYGDMKPEEVLEQEVEVISNIWE